MEKERSRTNRKLWQRQRDTDREMERERAQGREREIEKRTEWNRKIQRHNGA